MKRLGLLLVVLASTARAQDAPAESPPIEAARVEGDRLILPGDLPRAITLPCTPTYHAAHGTRLYAACGARLLIIDVEGPTLVADRVLETPVSGVHQSGDRVWLELSDGRALAADSVGDATLTPPPPPETAPPPPLEPTPTIPPPPSSNTSAWTQPRPGRVLSLVDGVAVVDLGRDDGLVVGRRVTFGSPDPGDPWGGTAQVVGVVDAVSPDRSRVQLGFGEQVEEGDEVRVTEAPPTARRAGPPRGARDWAVGATLRAFTPAQDLGLSLSVGAHVWRRLGRVGFAEAHLRPTGFSVAKGDDFGFGGGYVLFGIDMPLFAAGAGVGVEQILHEDFGFVDGYRPAVTFPVRARFGSEDGVMFELTTLLGVVYSETQFLGVDVEMQAPILRGSWLFVEGGGGRLPYWNTHVGVRHRLGGNGEAGTTFLRAAAGVAGTTEKTPARFRLGPSLSVGFESRY